MRRVGKSVLMQLQIEELITSGIPQPNILYINKESLEFEFIKTYSDLYLYAKNYFKGKAAQKYIFIDEVQEIAEWEKAITSFLSEHLADVVISGSMQDFFRQNLQHCFPAGMLRLPSIPLLLENFCYLERVAPI